MKTKKSVFRNCASSILFSSAVSQTSNTIVSRGFKPCATYNAIMHFEKLPVLSQVFPVYFYTITQWLLPLLTGGSGSCTKLALITLHFKNTHAVPTH